MELQKIINIFEEHGFNENNCSFFRQEDITDIAKELLEAINYTHSCESDSEQLHTEVFKLANKLAINGYGNEAVKMHQIYNGM